MCIYYIMLCMWVYVVKIEIDLLKGTKGTND